MAEAELPAMRIQVSARIRPLRQELVASETRTKWSHSGYELVDKESAGGAEKHYQFDNVLAPDCNNDECYAKVAKELVAAAVKGFNGTIFAYGQTGSGKTHSMLGGAEAVEQGAADGK